MFRPCLWLARQRGSRSCWDRIGRTVSEGNQASWNTSDRLNRFGGKFLAQAGESQLLEGDWIARRLSLMELESVERALALYNCAEYAALKPLREKAAHTRVILLQGTEARPIAGI